MSGYASAIAAITAVAGTAVSVATSVEQSNTQRRQAEYQADMSKYNAKVAEGNAQLAEQEGQRAKQEAHKAATRKRQETSLLIGQQRAKQGASGSQVDAGSNLDFNLDLAERGELDAMQIKEQGKWQDYNKKLDAWGTRSQGAIHTSQANKFSNQANQYSPFLSNGKTLLSDIENTSGQFINLLGQDKKR